MKHSKHPYLPPRPHLDTPPSTLSARTSEVDALLGAPAGAVPGGAGLGAESEHAYGGMGAGHDVQPSPPGLSGSSF